jgi:hypothetical protein
MTFTLGLLLGVALTVWVIVTAVLISQMIELENRFNRLVSEHDDTIRGFRASLSDHESWLGDHDKFIGREDTWDSRLDDFKRLVKEAITPPEWLTKGLKPEAKPAQTQRPGRGRPRKDA